MKKFEYIEERFIDFHELTELGQKGWEVIAIEFGVYESTNESIAYLKREII